MHLCRTSFFQCTLEEILFGAKILCNFFVELNLSRPIYPKGTTRQLKKNIKKMSEEHEEGQDNQEGEEEEQEQFEFNEAIQPPPEVPTKTMEEEEDCLYEEFINSINSLILNYFCFFSQDPDIFFLFITQESEII